MVGIIFVTLEMSFMSLTGQKVYNKLMLNRKEDKSKRTYWVSWLNNKRKSNSNCKKKRKFISLGNPKIKIYYKTGMNWMIVSLQLLMPKKLLPNSKEVNQLIFFSIEEKELLVRILTFKSLNTSSKKFRNKTKRLVNKDKNINLKRNT